MNINPFYVNPNYPNDFYPNVNSMQNQDIKNLEVRVYNLEREIANLKNKIIRLENLKSNDSYTNNYQANSYNMM